MMITVHTQSGVKTIKAVGTVLESLEKAGIQHQNHCREGFCGLCRCKAKGVVRYRTAPLGFVRKGEILPCISMAGERLEIKV